jgi:hypothetical protein
MTGVHLAAWEMKNRTPSAITLIIHSWIRLVLVLKEALALASAVPTRIWPGKLPFLLPQSPPTRDLDALRTKSTLERMTNAAPIEPELLLE